MTSRRRHITLTTLAAATALTAACLVAPPGRAATLDTVQRVSIGAGQADGASRFPALSGGGRKVAFQSTATNLVPWFAGATYGVFVRDRSGGFTVCASVRPDGTQAGGQSAAPSLDSAGDLVAFESSSPELVAGDTNGFRDVFVRSLTNNVTTLVSADTAGGPANGPSHTPAVSGDGRWVAFASDATDIGGTNDPGPYDAIHVRDLRDGRTLQVSVTLDGSPLTGDCGAPAISADGRYVAFSSDSANLVDGDTNGKRDVFVRDTFLNTTTRVSVSSSGQEANLLSQSPAISGDGRFVAFESQASNLVSGDGNGVFDVFLRDIQAGTTTRMSVSSLGAEGDGVSTGAAISSDGRFVAFTSAARTLVYGDTNALPDVYVRDTATRKTMCASLNGAGAQANGGSGSAALSPDGLFLAFSSEANDLVTGDTNGEADVFYRQAAPFAVERLAGPDRFGTAVAATERGFGSHADAVVIATGRNFPDALGGSALAGVVDAPVLLVEPTSMPATTAAAVRRLEPRHVYVLGSEKAVSAGVKASLDAIVGSANVTRIGGGDRYATARLVAARVAADARFDGTVYVATGGTYPDALAVSPLAAAHRRPVLLVPPGSTKAPALPPGTDRAIVLGSAAAVTNGCFDDLGRVLGTENVSRIGGSDRYATAALIAAAGAQDGLSFDGVALATGADFPDALSGGPVCARLGAVMMLTRPTSLPPVTADALRANAAYIDTLRFLGSSFAVSDAVVAQARQALGK